MINIKRFDTTSTAKLRKLLRDPKVNAPRRRKMYAELLRRRHFGR